MAVMSEKIGKELISALGLPPFSVTSLTLTCKGGAPAEVAITRLISSEEADKLVEIIERYELTERQD